MRLVILGAGGYGRMAADVAAQTGEYEAILFLDDNSQAEDVAGKCGAYADFADEHTAFYPAIGNNEIRLNWLEMLLAGGCRVANLIHPTAYISPTARMAQGVAVLPHAIVNTGCVLEMGCIVNSGAIVDHGCVLEAGAHVSPGGIVKAENRIPRCLKVESGEVVQNRTYPL